MYARTCLRRKVALPLLASAYPARIAAALAFMSRRYSSQNLRCLSVRSVTSNSKSTLATPCKNCKVTPRKT